MPHPSCIHTFLSRVPPDIAFSREGPSAPKVPTFGKGANLSGLDTFALAWPPSGRSASQRHDINLALRIVRSSAGLHLPTSKHSSPPSRSSPACSNRSKNTARRAAALTPEAPIANWGLFWLAHLSLNSSRGATCLSQVVTYLRRLRSF